MGCRENSAPFFRLFGGLLGRELRGTHEGDGDVLSLIRQLDLVDDVVVDLVALRHTQTVDGTGR